jgi:hypothetical protein
MRKLIARLINWLRPEPQGPAVASEIVTHEQLQALTGYTQLAAMRRELRRSGVPVRQTGGRLWTTTEAMTATLIGRAKQQKGPNFERLTQARQNKERKVLL